MVTTVSGKIISHAVQFARVVSDKKLKEHGLKRGDMVMVMGFRTSPISKSDPYLFRKYALVAKFVDGEIQIPDEENDYQSYLLDPRSLESVSDTEQQFYEECLKSQYDEGEAEGGIEGEGEGLAEEEAGSETMH